jgi:formyltetrahydrofolate synthetase
MMRLLHNPNSHVTYPLKDGNNFTIDNAKDYILKCGYFTQNSRQKAIWKRVTSEVIKYAFRGNVELASKVLKEVYQKPEYERGTLYKILGKRIRKDRKDKKLQKVMKEIYQNDLVDDVKRAIWKQEAIPEEEDYCLGTQQAEHQIKRIEKKKTKDIKNCQ